MSRLARLDKTGLRVLCNKGTCGGLLAPLRELQATTEAGLLLVRGGREFAVSQVRILGLSLIGAERRMRNGLICWNLPDRARKELRGSSRQGWRVKASLPATTIPPCQRAECSPPAFPVDDLIRRQPGERIRVTASSESGEPSFWFWTVGRLEPPQHWHGHDWEPEQKRIDSPTADLPSSIVCPRCRKQQILNAEALLLDGPPVTYKVVPR